VIPPIRIEQGLAVYADGTGDDILLIPTPHACTAGPEINKPLARLLVATGLRVITFDPPGAFRSTRQPSVSMDEMMQCSQEALRIADIGTPVMVCGHSMASVCAIGIALERPTIARGDINQSCGSSSGRGAWRTLRFDKNRGRL
jgi:alpha-beta hydrolase superfamily lysophospholipase